MTDATILIPTHRHAELLPYALRSALSQEGLSFELFVVGDGVEDETRAAVAGFADDERLRFFDLPKGERHGERNRHEALQEATGEIVCYLSDDDLLLPGHLLQMRELLEHADLALPPPVSVDPDGTVVYRPADLGRPEFVDLIRQGRNNFIGLTGAAHTRAAYERLPHGWRPAPPGTPTDVYMWQQFCALPGFRGATGTTLTALHFPDPKWRVVDTSERGAVLASWLETTSGADAAERLDNILADATRAAAQTFKLRSIELSGALREATAEVERLRAPLARRLARRARAARSRRP